jgi:hypothetical protein
MERRSAQSRGAAPREASLPHGDEVGTDIATLMMASAFAGVYRDVLGKPVPMPLRAILQKMGTRRARRQTVR